MRSAVLRIAVRLAAPLSLGARAIHAEILQPPLASRKRRLKLTKLLTHAAVSDRVPAEMRHTHAREERKHKRKRS